MVLTAKDGSVIRLNKSKKENDFYSLIENNIIEV